MALDPILSPHALASLTGVVLLDCRTDTAAYVAGHLPGAQHAQLERDLAAPASDPARGGRHPLPSLAAFAATLGRWGVTPRSHVVAYDDQQGANAASRLWWLLKEVGHDAVQIVHGGLAALVAAGFVLTADAPAVAAAPPYPVTAWTRATADLAEVGQGRG